MAAEKNDLGVTPLSEDVSAWYNELVLKAELADRGPAKGTMVIRPPYGYRIRELRPRILLCTTEFLWREGHTAHADQADATEETLRMMRDGEALQSGTSHYLGTSFATAFDITHQDEHNELQHVHTTSWGMSTRMIGAVILAHGDDAALVLPPRLAPIQVVMVPFRVELGSRGVQAGHVALAQRVARSTTGMASPTRSRSASRGRCTAVPRRVRTTSRRRPLPHPAASPPMASRSRGPAAAAVQRPRTAPASRSPAPTEP